MLLKESGFILLQRDDGMNKRKLIIAVLSLLMCFALLLSSSFAWLSLSRAPEITGVDTYIGANGSLEIALLSDNTYMDPSTIRSATGDSMVVQEAIVSNLSWGNLVDLSDKAYGLNEISMIPSRLNVFQGDEGNLIVSNNMLAIPQYGLDGRFSEFLVNTVSAVNNGSSFNCATGVQHYGVRGIGSVSGVTVQQSALANARSLVRSYQAASISAAQSVWVSNGRGLLGILYRHFALSETDGYNAADLALLRDTAVRINNALSYVDLALRQGVVGMMATILVNADEFRELRQTVENTSIPLSLILEAASDNIPSDLKTRARAVDEDRLEMQQVIAVCDKLAGTASYRGVYPWAIIDEIVHRLLKYEKTYLGNDLIRNAAPFNNMVVDNLLTLSPNSGVMANIAHYSGNYNAFFEFARENDDHDLSVEVVTRATNVDSTLDTVYEILMKSDITSGNGTEAEVALDDVFGYAVDMGFRCNESCDLLLQTAPEDRVEENLDLVTTQGGGSYMRFDSEQLTKEQILMMMDALRVAFLDNQSHMIALAKLNTSNYSEIDSAISAPLYLYEHNVSADGSISIGERKDEQIKIMSLTEDIPAVLTVVVWLDGDHVDNSLASISGMSMTGALNLQFSSSADLLPSNQDMKPN